MAARSSPLDNSTEDLLRALDRRILKRSNTLAPTITKDQWAFRSAAAVLTAFDLSKLRPWYETKQSRVTQTPLVLKNDIVEAPGERARGLYMLKTNVRQETLQRLKTKRRMIQVLDANPQRVRSDFQKLFEAWIKGRQKPVNSQSYRELIWSTQIVRWLKGTLDNIPDPEEFKIQLGRRSVYALFEHLATDSFTGREVELTLMREHVGVLDPATRRASLLRGLRSALGIKRRPPLVVEGPGGVGKSSLIARFLIDHMDVEYERRFPFAYLAFDSPLLKVEEPHTLVAEIYRQIQLLFPQFQSEFTKFDDEFHRYNARRAQLQERAYQSSSRLQKLNGRSQADKTLYETFCLLINGISARLSRDSRDAAPFLLVLDTFEEAQYRGPERLAGLFELLKILFERCPGLRIVISMRSPMTVPLPESLGKPTHLELQDLPREASLLLLKRLGVDDADLANAAVTQIGGNPLNLLLAARLLKSDNVEKEGIRGLRTTSWLLFSVSDEIIRGQLYSRLLDHIHDEHVRKLAHPGMVLRRVTPELIIDVLSGPCNVPVESIEDAKALCVQLAQEHTLVNIESDGALSYRPDIRVPTLKLLEQDRPRQVEEIHISAIKFYMRQRGSIAEQAEEMYHRLALDQEISQLDRVWQTEFVPFLMSAFEELPAGAQAWLAPKLGRDTSPDVRRRASLYEWERLIGPKVRYLLRYSRIHDALQLLKEREDRTAASPLYALEAKCHLLLLDFEAATDALRRGIDVISKEPNRGRLAELFWLQAQTYEMEGRLEDADEILMRAEVVAQSIPNATSLVQILAQRLLLRREATFEGKEQADPIRMRLAQAFSRLSDSAMAQERSLIHVALALLGSSFTGLFVKGLRSAGLGDIRDDVARSLAFNIRQSLALETSFEAANLSSDLLQQNQNLDSLLPHILNSPELRAAVLPLLDEILVNQGQSFAAADLAGIDDYRESWELELSREVSA